MAKCYGHGITECYAIVSKKGDFCDACKLRNLEATNKELLELVKTYKNMPFGCHDYMTAEQWERICNICAEKEK